MKSRGIDFLCQSLFVTLLTLDSFCSSKVVEKFLLDQSNYVQTNAYLHWDKLCRYHADVVIALLRQNLMKRGETSCVVAWDNWYRLVNTKRVGAAFTSSLRRVQGEKTTVGVELIRNAKASKKLVELLGQFPPPNSIRKCAC